MTRDRVIKDGLEPCPGCGSDIDPDTCWCGIAVADHDPLITQCPCIPVGCNCYRSAARKGHADDKL